jgi:hypothetical protein
MNELMKSLPKPNLQKICFETKFEIGPLTYDGLGINSY